MKTFSTKNKLKKTAIAIGSLIFWVGLWQFASIAIGDEFFLPGPLPVMKEMLRLPGESAFFPALGMSVLRVLAGYASGVVIGVLLAILTCRFAIVKGLIEPLLSVIRATPVVSFVILAFLLFDRSHVPSYIVILMVAPMVWANMSEGIGRVDKSLKEMVYVFRFKPYAAFRHLWFPSLKPYFASIAVSAFGFAWKSGVAAEIICYPNMSIGKMIYNSRVALDSISVFAITVYVIILSFIFEKILKSILRKKVIRSDKNKTPKEEENGK